MSGSSIGSVSSSGSDSVSSIGSVSSSGSDSVSSIGSSGSASSIGSSGSARNIRLAPIYVLTQSELYSMIKNKNKNVDPTKWNGRKPIKNELLYVPHVNISDETYNENIPVDFSIEQKIKRRKLYDTPQAAILLGDETRKFDHMRIRDFLSFIHYPSAEREHTFGTSSSMFGIKEPLQEKLLDNLMKKYKIYKNKYSNDSFWYVLHSTDDYSELYYSVPKRYRISKYPNIRIVSKAKLEDEYTPLIDYFPTETRLFSSELGLRSVLGKKRGRSSLNAPRGGKSHRNRRNRRKTAVKRRTTLKQRKRSKCIK